MISSNIEEDINMLKKERLVKIAHKVNQNGIITIQEIMDELGVSDMTARRNYLEFMVEHKAFLFQWTTN